MSSINDRRSDSLHGNGTWCKFSIEMNDCDPKLASMLRVLLPMIMKLEDHKMIKSKEAK